MSQQHRLVSSVQPKCQAAPQSVPHPVLLSCPVNYKYTPAVLIMAACWYHFNLINLSWFQLIGLSASVLWHLHVKDFSIVRKWLHLMWDSGVRLWTRWWKEFIKQFDSNPVDSQRHCSVLTTLVFTTVTRHTSGSSEDCRRTAIIIIYTRSQQKKKQTASGQRVKSKARVFHVLI